MPKPTPALTGEITFAVINVEQQPLFAVRPGLPATDTLEHVSCLLDVVTELTRDLGFESVEPTGETRKAWAALYLTEMARAAVDAVVLGAYHNAATPTGEAQ
jgi:hypothetical protein